MSLPGPDASSPEVSPCSLGPAPRALSGLHHFLRNTLHSPGASGRESPRCPAPPPPRDIAPPAALVLLASQSSSSLLLAPPPAPPLPPRPGFLEPPPGPAPTIRLLLPGPPLPRPPTFFLPPTLARALLTSPRESASGRAARELGAVRSPSSPLSVPAPPRPLFRVSASLASRSRKPLRASPAAGLRATSGGSLSAHRELREWV